MPRAKSDSIEAMGTERFLNSRFAYLEEKFGMKPYEKFVQLLHYPDSEIAKIFSTEDRKLNYQTPSTWRRAHLEEKNSGTPDVKQ